MSRQTPHVAGAEAPRESDDPALQDAVAALLHLSSEDMENLNSYTSSTCEEKLRELVDYFNHPAGKPELIIPDLLGQMFLLYLRRTQLQNAVHQAQFTQLRNSYQAVLQAALSLRREARQNQAEISQIREDNARLQEDTEILRREVQCTQPEMTQVQEDNKTLHAQIQNAQRRAEDRRAQIQAAQPGAEDWCEEIQAGQVSTAADTATQETPCTSSDLEEGPLPGTPSQNLLPEDPAVQEEATQLSLEPRATPAGEAAQVSEQTTPDNQGMHVRSLAAPSGTVSDLSIPDTCQAPPSARLLDAGAQPSRSEPQSILSRTSVRPDRIGSPPRRGEDDSQAQSDVSGFGSPLASELYPSQSSRPRFSRTPSPPRQERSCPHRFVRPARGHEGGARVLEIQASGNAELGLTGNKKPRVKMKVRTGPQRRRPPRQQGGQQNQGGDDQTHPQGQIKSRQHNTFQPKGKAPNPPRGDGFNQEMDNLIQRCLTKALKHFNMLHRPPAPPDPPQELGAAAPSA